MIPAMSCLNSSLVCIPRESGDDPSRPNDALRLLMYSPRERG